MGITSYAKGYIDMVFHPERVMAKKFGVETNTQIAYT